MINLEASLTHRQREIFEYIVERIKQNGYPPTIREISHHFDIQIQAVIDHLNALEKKEILQRDKRVARGIKLLIPPSQIEVLSEDVVLIPLVGKTTAGEPILVEQNIEDWIPIPKSKIKSKGTIFLLRIKGDSMIGDYILDNDIILVRSQKTAENGEIVVAMIDDGATIKRFYREEGYIRLQPSNKSYEPIILREDSQRIFQICGKYIGLLRNII